MNSEISELIAELRIERMSREHGGCQGCRDSQCEKAADALASHLALIKSLTEALRPFAREGANALNYDETKPISEQPEAFLANHIVVTIGEVTRACSALASARTPLPSANSSEKT